MAKPMDSDTRLHYLATAFIYTQQEEEIREKRAAAKGSPASFEMLLQFNPDGTRHWLRYFACQMEFDGHPSRLLTDGISKRNAY